MSLERIIAEGLLAERPKVIRAECLTCGRAIDAVKATHGGLSRCCSQLCVEYFDNGWFFDGSNGRPVSVPTSDHTEAKSASLARKSERQKAAWKVKRKATLAESWKRYKSKQKENGSQ